MAAFCSATTAHASVDRVRETGQLHHWIWSCVSVRIEVLVSVLLLRLLPYPMHLTLSSGSYVRPVSGSMWKLIIPLLTVVMATVFVPLLLCVSAS